MEKSVLLLATFIVASFTAPMPNDYEMFDNHQVLRIIPQSEEHLKQLYAIENEGLYVDFWIEPRKPGKAVVVRVSPEQIEKVTSYLKKHGMEHSVHVENLRNNMERELLELMNRVTFNQGDHPSKLTMDQYHNLDEINAYLTMVASTNPAMATVMSIGNSHLNRPMNVIKIGNAGANKPAVWIDGGLHAREWISTATILYIINELTTKPAMYMNMLNRIDVYLMPVANPDGYAWTWSNDRMWRKTRSGPRAGCYGADPNRNWNYQWMVAGSSNNPCSETYAGPSAFSEIESYNIASWLTTNKAKVKAYFNLHSYSEDWMYPFGYAAMTYPPDVAKLRTISAQAVAAINAVNNQRFKYGSITDIVYPASGSTIDYTNAVLNIDYSFGMELRPSDTDPNGFQLPASQIIAGASETWAGLQIVLNRVASGQ